MYLTENQVREIEIPNKTDTYEPVSNSFIINLIKEISNDYQYELMNVNYKSTKNRNVVVGIFTFDGYDEDMGMQMAFINSYDKSRSVKIATGATIFVCENGMISNAEELFSRKHMGTIKDELMDMIDDSFKKMSENYHKLTDFKDAARNTNISITEMFRIIGNLYFSTELLSSRQLTFLKNQFYDKNFGIFNDRTSIWNIYNWITEIYKKESAVNHINKHIKLHNYFDNLLPNYL